MVTAYAARTTFPNTPETDAMPTVYHTVDYSTDSGASGTVYIKAAGPDDALRFVNRLSEAELLMFDKKPESN